MSFFRVFTHQIQRSLSLSHNLLNNGLFLYKKTGQKLIDIRQLSNVSELTRAKKFVNGFENLPELQSADENVQRIFSLANASHRDRRKVAENEMVKKCQNARERKIARMTISIQNLENHVGSMRNKDKHNKVYLQWLTDQRTKKLKNLKLTNFPRYVELIKELKIDPLPSMHSKYAKYKFRRFKIGVEIREKRSQAVRKMPSLKNKFL